MTAAVQQTTVQPTPVQTTPALVLQQQMQAATIQDQPAPVRTTAVPSLTPTPDASDEPVPVSGPVSTVTEYFLVKDSFGELPNNNVGKLTLADFNLGPLPAKVVTPSDVDPTTNQAPYFINLDNPTVYVGEELAVTFDPEDDDGTRPGMYPEYLRDGWSLIDNRNNTRTLRWKPLQPDVGIHEFTIVAVDEEAPQYRTFQTIRIQCH